MKLFELEFLALEAEVHVELLVWKDALNGILEKEGKSLHVDTCTIELALSSLMIFSSTLNGY